MSIQDLIGLQAWELEAHTNMGVKIIPFKIEPVVNIVSVVIDPQGVVCAAVPGIIKRVVQEVE